MLEILKQVQLFTSEFQGLLEDDIKEDSSIENDLGIYGDDANEYLIAFGKEFRVDVSKFMAADYFSSEGDFKLPPFISNFFKKVEHTKNKNLKIKHLMKAIEIGRLDEETINSV